MKVLQINTFGNLSTGRIAVDLYRVLHENNHDGVIAFARNMIEAEVPNIRIGSKCSVYTDGIMTRLTDKAGFYSTGPTKRLIEQIRTYDPDIIHLHNLHGYYINVELLFTYLKETEKPVVWTLHDCWSFTGHCCNFESVNCGKWRTGCYDCEQKRRYPASIVIDSSISNYQKKKKLFTDLDKMILVTPSVWLQTLVKQSYMNKFPVEVIRNGVDLEIFKPIDGDWRKRNGLENKKIILGVAATWTATKGLNDFIKLSRMLDDSYQIVIVGVTEKQKKKLPLNIVSLCRTDNIQELVQIYSSAHFFLNPTYDDNFPNVNLEALACGTPVITYKTGGSPEAIDEKSGAIVEQGDLKAVKSVIMYNKFSKNDCIEQARKFRKEKSYLRYIDLYKNILSK